jgi:hypothetical protein
MLIRPSITDALQSRNLTASLKANLKKYVLYFERNVLIYLSWVYFFRIFYITGPNIFLFISRCVKCASSLFLRLRVTKMLVLDTCIWQIFFLHFWVLYLFEIFDVYLTIVCFNNNNNNNNNNDDGCWVTLENFRNVPNNSMFLLYF